VGRSADPLKEADHDYRSASGRDSLSEADRGCQKARDVAAASEAAQKRRRRALPLRAGRAVVGRVDRRPGDAGQANRPEYFEQQAAEAGHAEPWAQVWALKIAALRWEPMASLRVEPQETESKKEAG
jgi:hypothetical protein